MHTKSTLSCLAILLLISQAAKADFVVASNLPATQLDTGTWEEVGLIAPAYNNYNNVAKGQTFIPSRSGLLTNVDALIGAGRLQPVPNSPPLRVSIYTSAAGIPISPLATVQFPASVFPGYLTPANTRKTIDFSSFHIPLTAGNQYMATFETPFGVNGTDGSDSAFFIGWPNSQLGLSASQARNGVNWERFQDPRELALEVRAVPEPASALPMLIAACAAAAARFRPARARG